MKNPQKVAQGRRSKAQGKRFEASVKKDLEKKGFIVCRWSNNVDLKENKLVQSKAKYNPFTKTIMMRNSGFPDYLAFCESMFHPKNFISWGENSIPANFVVIGVECKMKGILDKEEKEKCKWYLDNKVFSKIYIVKKGSKRGTIEYIEYGKTN